MKNENKDCYSPRIALFRKDDDHLHDRGRIFRAYDP